MAKIPAKSLNEEKDKSNLIVKNSRYEKSALE